MTLPLAGIHTPSVWLDMPKLGADYDTAKALFVKGLSLSKIAKQLNIPYAGLAKFSVRNGWTQTKTQSVQLLSQHVQGVLQERSTAHLLKVSSLADKALDNLIVKDLATMKLNDLQTLATIADTFDKIARRTYGLDSEQHKQQINLSVNVSPGEHQVLGRVIDIPKIEDTQ